MESARAPSLEAIIGELHAATTANRTTLRLDAPGEDFPVVVESLAPGMRPIAGDVSFGIRSAGTVRYLESEQKVLVQRDILGVEPAPAPELVERYGARAQMLAPLIREGRLIGIVSVHHAGGIRDFTSDEVAALEQAVDLILTELPASEAS